MLNIYSKGAYTLFERAAWLARVYCGSAWFLFVKHKPSTAGLGGEVGHVRLCARFPAR